MDVLPQTSLFIGIIPALFLLYLSLKGYEGYYKDKNIFLSLLAGLVAGFFAAFMELVTIGAGIIVIVLFPVLEQILKMMILNIRRLQERGDTTVYGLSLGLGFGSIFTPVTMIIANVQTESLALMLLVIIGSMGIILIHGATGAIIGYGIYAHKLSKYFVLALVLHFPVTSWFFITTFYEVEQYQIGLIFYGLVIYWYATKKIMPQILTTRERRKRRRKTSFINTD
jgi:hypothetical protein